ncbi:hypothetical protein [Viridibacterium curvum]|uniref:Lipoprotein n=1 Tax=Viridibacterium curvum TaxID=1101404 RepID=A0ABP9QWJ1_9RHOO
MKKLAIFISLLSVGCANAANLNWFCFVSKDEAKPIYLAFAFANNKSTDAFVRYRNGSGVISLKQKSLESIEMAEGRPFENTYEYIEKTGRADAGRYTVVVQGAVFYGFSYTSTKRAKPYEFVMDTASEGGSGCKW